MPSCAAIFFFFNDTATTEIYTLSLHDALPICAGVGVMLTASANVVQSAFPASEQGEISGLSRSVSNLGSSLGTADRKSTRLNSSHSQISYAVFCLKKKKK